MEEGDRSTEPQEQRKMKVLGKREKRSGAEIILARCFSVGAGG
jgi:hypothetical protein